jgi:hypothetical protein
VTSLGEFSPIGRLFTLGSGFKITEVVQIFRLLFFNGTSYVCIHCDKKMVGLHFGRLFQKTHLVALDNSSAQKMTKLRIF